MIIDSAQTVKIEPCHGPNSPIRSVRTSLVSDVIVSFLSESLYSFKRKNRLLQMNLALKNTSRLIYDQK